MNLAPLMNAPLVIRLHAFVALGAFVLGAVQLLAPKGTLPHRRLGYVWVVLLGFIAISSFWIHQIRQFGDFSVIHLISIFTLITLPLAVIRARRHQIRQHRRGMTLLYLGALVVAGGFTLFPGRIMYYVVFGH